MHTILGAGGIIGNELTKELVLRGERVRLVSRHPQLLGGAVETIGADLSHLQETIDAVAGSRVVYLMAGLKYDTKVWRDLWPPVMRNAIEACKRAGARLVFFDNVYMYGKASGAMTEETPFSPCSRKGEIRAEVATMVLNEIQAGTLTALIARSADFYGPGAKNGVPNVLVFDRLAEGKKPYCLVNDAVPHSYSFVPDAAKGLAILTASEQSWNQTWHIPTAPNPPTGSEFIDMAAREFNALPDYVVMKKWMLKCVGVVDATVRESYEMLYQNESAYLFDSTKFAHFFHYTPTPYLDGIKQTAAASKSR